MSDVCVLLPKWKGVVSPLLQLPNLPALVPALLDSSAAHPRIHTVWSYILPSGDEPAEGAAPAKKKAKAGGDKHEFLAALWSQVVDQGPPLCLQPSHLSLSVPTTRALLTPCSLPAHSLPTACSLPAHSLLTP